MFQCPHGLELLRFALQCFFHLESFQCPHGLELLLAFVVKFGKSDKSFNALMGLSCYLIPECYKAVKESFNALMGLSCYNSLYVFILVLTSFNALMGLSCYGKNVQYFKFFMILSMHTCYL